MLSNDVNSSNEKNKIVILNPYGIKLFGYDSEKIKPNSIVSKVDI